MLRGVIIIIIKSRCDNLWWFSILDDEILGGCHGRWVAQRPQVILLRDITQCACVRAFQARERMEILEVYARCNPHWTRSRLWLQRCWYFATSTQVLAQVPKCQHIISHIYRVLPTNCFKWDDRPGKPRGFTCVSFRIGRRGIYLQGFQYLHIPCTH